VFEVSQHSARPFCDFDCNIVCVGGLRGSGFHMTLAVSDKSHRGRISIKCCTGRAVRQALIELWYSTL
jgi:hypothetical protein